ncbi:MAG: nucleoside triphosphate pyrophosphohydrolase [Patescibacteria group bacterium]
MKYNKLVRDKIPGYIKSKGGMPIVHIANDTEYWEKLKEKLLEEAKEFIESESVEKMADIEEVLGAIRTCKKFDQADIEKARIAKVKERGAFEKKIILEES